MNDAAIAAMIREVLAEEVEKIGGKKALRTVDAAAPVREESVSIATDQELAEFVRRILQIADDDDTRKAFEQGRFVFRLNGSAHDRQPAEERPPAPDGTFTVSSGFFSERQVNQLPKGTTAVALGSAVKVTPLARDRLRSRGIRIERTDQ